MSYLLSILLTFLVVFITLTKSQNINPNYHQIHIESASVDGLISYLQPPTTDLQKLDGLKYTLPRRLDEEERGHIPIHIPQTPHTRLQNRRYRIRRRRPPP
jgi:hypothetical protein